MNTAAEKDKKEFLWTIREVLNWTTKRFSECGIETPLLDAQLLLCHVLKIKNSTLY